MMKGWGSKKAAPPPASAPLPAPVAGKSPAQPSSQLPAAPAGGKGPTPVAPMAGRPDQPGASLRGPPAPAAAAVGAQALAAAFAEPLPAFRDVPAADRQALFARKLALCSHVFSFTEPDGCLAREKEVKRATLVELVEYVNTGTGKLTEPLFDNITSFVAANLFRALPPTGAETTGVGGGEAFDADEEEPALEPAWAHLQARPRPSPWPAARL